MKRIAEAASIIVLIIAMVLLLLYTVIVILDIPESETKKIAIVVLLPIIGAIITGLLLEVFKFWLSVNDEKSKRNSVVISEMIKLSTSISMNLFEKDGVLFIKDEDQYQLNLRSIFQLVTSTGSADSIASLKPLLQILNTDEYLPINKNGVCSALKNSVIDIRKSLGYINTKESNEVIELMFK